MPWCPKCKSEYRREIAQCPRCGEALVDENPNPPEPQPYLSYGIVLELAVIFLLAPWGWVFAARWLLPPDWHALDAEWLAWLLPILPVFAIAFLYGYWRWTRVCIAAVVLGSVVGLGVELLATAVLLSLGQPDSYPLVPIVLVVMFGGYSVPAVAFAWLGAKLHWLIYLRRAQA